MKKLFSIGLCLAILALCAAPLFFPNDAKAEQPSVQASDLESSDQGVDYNSLPDGGNSTDSAANAQAQGAQTDAETTDPVAPEPSVFLRWWEWLQKNGAALIVAFGGFLVAGETLARITPTTKDDSFFKWLRRIFDIIPNLKKGGGTHPPA